MNSVWDGTVVPLADQVPPELPSDRTGVFETVLLLGGRPIFWPEHLARFNAGRAALGLGSVPTAHALTAAVNQLVNDNAITDGVVRYAAWRDGGETHWRVDVTPPRPHLATSTFRITRGPALPPPAADRAHKHLNRIAWSAALRDARRAGFDETVLTDDGGRIVEGAVSNIFLVRGNHLLTPPLACGALPGIMRAAVLACARAAGCEVRESLVTVDEVRTAEEVWFTNSLIGIRPVTQFDAHPYPESYAFLAWFRRHWREHHGWDPVVVLRRSA